MSAPTEDEIRRVHQWECSLQGHDWRAVSDDAMRPVAVTCARCEQTHQVRPDPWVTERVGWVRFDGDEYHDFRYSSPGEKRTMADVMQNYLPVYVEKPSGSGE